jgi:phenylalanyl-tRNA synthetase beta chain
MTALARTGARLGDFTIRAAKIRGVESSGMLCSEKELGISEEQAGIMRLPDNCTTGSPLRDYYPDDAIIEIELTPNRGDCLSILGVARELSAKLGIALKQPDSTPAESQESIEQHIQAAIDNPDRCPRYMGRLVTGVTMGESPLWMKQRLRASGIRPINNIVDVTNYIMLMYGQPMHAFDYRLLENKRIIVKTASDKQTFVTLDDIERTLTADDLLICDGKRPVALAGVMGGAGSEISEQTVDVFLECAYFDPIGIRKTAKRLDLSTDSSYRFERGVDCGQGLERALDAAAELIRRTAGGSIARGVVDAYPAPHRAREITLRAERVNSLLGVEMTAERMKEILESLAIRLIDDSGAAMRFAAPSWRHDLEIEADLIEEIGRMYGYDSIPSTERTAISLVRDRNRTESMLDAIRGALCCQGLHEAVTNSMTSEQLRAMTTPDIAPVNVHNPLTPDMAQMRTTLVASLLDCVARNINHRNLDNGFFEIGKTYAALPEQTLPDERDVAAILIEGNFFPGSWNSAPREVDFWILKGLLESFFAYLRLPPARFEMLTDGAPAFLAVEGAVIRTAHGVEGVAGKIAPSLLRRFDIKTSVYYAQLDITQLLRADLSWAWYEPLPRYPAVERDFSFVMPDTLASANVQQALESASPLVEQVRPFDVYRGEKIGANNKSVSYAVRLRAHDRTLTDKEAETICEDMIATARKTFGIDLRS